MATFVLVEDGSPGNVQHKINVTPATPLTDILEVACQKFKVKPDGRGLKRNGKPLDLSLSFRLAGIPQGSRLLVYRLSTSASTATVLVAVQLVESGERVAEKYPITSSIWSILKSAEAQSARERKPGVNITTRCEPRSAPGKNEGAGRLYYTRPVVQVLSRELSDLNDLKQSLKQLGITKGTALLRVKFEKTAIPYEEAMVQIESVFPAEESEKSTPGEATPVATSSEENTKEGTLIDFGLDEVTKEEDVQMENTAEPEEQKKMPLQGVSVYRPSENSTPRAALTEYNEEDYEVTVPLAKIHQAHLQQASQGRRLPSDKEIEAQQRERNEKASNANLLVRIRFPDGMIVEKNFKGMDTAMDLYEFVKTVLRHPEQDFSLCLSPPHRTLPRDNASLFIKHGFSQKTLVNFVWKDTTPSEVKKSHALADAFQNNATDIPVPEEVKAEPEEEGGSKTDESKKKPAAGGPNRGAGDGLTKKLPKWLNLGRK